MLTSCYYDKAGNPIDIIKFANLFEREGYKIVQQDRLWWGGFLSTVWLGIDHSFGFNSTGPLIFETMLFSNKSYFNDLDMQRYSTEEEALAGHIAMKHKYSNPLELVSLFWKNRKAN